MDVDQEALFDVCSQHDYSVTPDGYEIEKSDGAYYWHREAEGQFDEQNHLTLFLIHLRPLVLTRGTIMATLPTITLRHCNTGLSVIG